MDEVEFDWNQAWKDARARRGPGHKRGADYWDKRAPSFAKHSKRSPYASAFLRLLGPSPDWSVLDVGCGAGTLAIPLARRVERITAMDISATMLDLLGDRCEQDGITNVTPVRLDWEDDWRAAGIGVHDVAIASRSMLVDDLKGAISKLNDHATVKVMVSLPVADGPFDRALFEAIDRDLDRGPDYIYLYNLLHQMGIFADVAIVAGSRRPKVYSDLDDAISGYRWMIEDMTHEEESRLRHYLEKHLVRSGAGWTLSRRHPVRWAVISWSVRPG